MKKMLILTIIFCSCNNAKDDANQAIPATEDAKPTDTRTVNPSDTSMMIDTGSYKQLSDSIRKE